MKWRQPNYFHGRSSWRHHYVPQFLLRRFSDGGLYVQRLPAGHPRIEAIQETCMVTNLNWFRGKSFERWWTDHCDTPMSESISEWEQDGANHLLPIVPAVAVMPLRHPLTQSRLDAVIRSANMPLSVSGKNAPVSFCESVQSHWVMAIERQHVDLEIIRAPIGSEFVLGDRPVESADEFLFLYFDHLGNIEWEDPSAGTLRPTTLRMPLDRRTAIGVTASPNATGSIASYDASPSEVAALNAGQKSRASKYLMGASAQVLWSTP